MSGFFNTFLGIKIIESAMVEPVQTLRLRDDFEWMTDKGRAEMNQWLLEMFGKKEVMYFLPGMDAAIMSPKNLAMLRLGAL